MLLQQLVRAAATAMQHAGSSKHLTQQCVSATLQHTSLLGAAAGGVVRRASSKGRGSGRKSSPHVRGYDRLLSQWQHMTARPGSTNSTKGSKTIKRPHAFSSYGSDQAYHSKPKKHKPSSTWYDADLAQAAAASQLHPDEFHNLFFGHSHSRSDSTSKGPSRRQARKQARKRAKQLRKQAQAMGASGYGFAWAEAGAAEGRWHAAYGSDDDSYSDSDDDEYLGGAYSYYSPGQRRAHRQTRQWEWQQEQPDWQWWTAEQEREWFQQAWQNGNSGSQQRQQHTGHHQAWWERFQQQRQQAHHQHHQQQQQQQQRQHQWQRWGYSSSSSNSGSSTAGSGSHWQQSIASHTPAILQHLTALGLPPSTQLQRQQLKAAFHKAAMQWHPDKHPEASAKAAAEDKFKQAKAAYEVLVQHATA